MFKATVPEGRICTFPFSPSPSYSALCCQHYKLLLLLRPHDVSLHTPPLAPNPAQMNTGGWKKDSLSSFPIMGTAKPFDVPQPWLPAIWMSPIFSKDYTLFSLAALYAWNQFPQHAHNVTSLSFEYHPQDTFSGLPLACTGLTGYSFPLPLPVTVSLPSAASLCWFLDCNVFRVRTCPTFNSR